MSADTPTQVLIIEDDIVIADMIAMTCERLGYEIAEQHQTGEGALDWFKNNHADIVLQDIFLDGDMDGFQTAAAIGKNYDIPIIFVTSNPDQSHVEKLKIPRVYGYLLKPIKEQELGRYIEYGLYKHKIEKDLERNEAWLNNILNSIHDGVVVLNTEFQILYANPRAEQLLDLAPNDMHKQVDGVITIKDWEKKEPIDITSLDLDMESPVRLICITKKGEEAVVEIQATTSESDQSVYVIVFREISHQVELEESLLETSEELRNLNHRIVSAQEEERKRLAHELHDDLGQYLVRLKMDLSSIERNIGKKDKLIAKVESAKGILADTVKIVKDLTYSLRPQLIEHFGLRVAVEDLLKKTAEHAEIEVISDFQKGLSNTFSYNMSLDVYRIIQESLTNILKYAEADSIQLTCKRVDGDFYVEIRDDGEGFDIKKLEEGTGLGILGMKERAARWGGRVDISSAPGTGTMVRLIIPDYEQN